MTRCRFQTGLTLVEVLISMILLSIVLIPAINALQTGSVGAAVHADLADNQFRLTSRLEQMLAEPFTGLELAAQAAGAPTVPSSYSDPAGPGRLLVFLSYYDGDDADGDNNPFTGWDEDLLWIRVEAEGTVHSLQTITVRGY